VAIAPAPSPPRTARTSPPPRATRQHYRRNGIVTSAQILSATPTQVTFLVPATVAIGTAQVTVSNGTTTQTSNNVDITTVSPAIYTANGSGLARANYYRDRPAER